jgi:hypothetical protein
MMGRTDTAAVGVKISTVAGILCITCTLAGYGALLFFWPQWQTFWILPSSSAPWFWDSYVVLAASDLHAAGIDPYGMNPLYIRHVYPRAWLGLANLGLTRDDSLWLGLALGGSFLGAALFWMRPHHYKQAGYVVAVLLAPPLTLGFQRGNSDLVIVLIVGGLLLALLHEKAVIRNGAGLVLLVFATLLKFYPAVIAGVMVCNETRWGRRIRVALLLLVVLGCVSFPLLEDYRRIATYTTLGELGQSGIYSYGADFSAPLLVVAWSGVMICMAGAWAGWAKLANMLPALRRESAPLGFMLGGTVLLGCFFAGSSYSYRLVFVVLMIPWWWQMRDDTKSAGVRKMASAGLILTLLLLWRDAGAALALQKGRHFFGIDFHNAVATYHRPVLALIGWMWCALVTCWLAAMVRKWPLTKAS